MGSIDGLRRWIGAEIGNATIADSVLLIHILAGVVAVLAGFGAIVTLKGGRRHNQTGKLYAVMMSIVVVTAIPLAVWTDDWFLFAIAIFTGYLIAAGYRIVLRRRGGVQGVTATDYALHGVMITVGLAMIVGGSYGTLTGWMELGYVLAVLGGIGGSLAVRELRQFRVSETERTPWFERHIGFMGGGYIATITAAVTVNLTMLPPVLRWLGPTLVGVPMIFYAIRTYRPRFG